MAILTKTDASSSFSLRIVLIYVTYYVTSEVKY